VDSKSPEGTGSCSQTILAPLIGTENNRSDGSRKSLKSHERPLRHAHGVARAEPLYTCANRG